jgi:hypothetical protein
MIYGAAGGTMLARCGPACRRLLVTPPGSSRAHVVSARIPRYAHLSVPACTPIRVSPVAPFPAVSYLAQHGVSPWQRRRGPGQGVSRAHRPG